MPFPEDNHDIYQHEGPQKLYHPCGHSRGPMLLRNLCHNSCAASEIAGRGDPEAQNPICNSKRSGTSEILRRPLLRCDMDLNSKAGLLLVHLHQADVDRDHLPRFTWKRDSQTHEVHLECRGELLDLKPQLLKSWKNCIPDSVPDPLLRYWDTCRCSNNTSASAN